MSSIRMKRPIPLLGAAPQEQHVLDHGPHRRSRLMDGPRMCRAGSLSCGPCTLGLIGLTERGGKPQVFLGRLSTIAGLSTSTLLYKRVNAPIMALATPNLQAVKLWHTTQIQTWCSLRYQILSSQRMMVKPSASHSFTNIYRKLYQ